MKILIPLDGSSSAEGIIKTAVRLAVTWSPVLVVLRNIKPLRSSDDTNSRTGVFLKR